MTMLRAADIIQLTDILHLFYNLVWGPWRLTRRSMRDYRTLGGDRWIRIPVMVYIYASAIVCCENLHKSNVSRDRRQTKPSVSLTAFSSRHETRPLFHPFTVWQKQTQLDPITLEIRSLNKGHMVGIRVGCNY